MALTVDLEHISFTDLCEAIIKPKADGRNDGETEPDAHLGFIKKVQTSPGQPQPFSVTLKTPCLGFNPVLLNWGHFTSLIPLLLESDRARRRRGSSDRASLLPSSDAGLSYVRKAQGLRLKL